MRSKFQTNLESFIPLAKEGAVLKRKEMPAEDKVSERETLNEFREELVGEAALLRKTDAKTQRRIYAYQEKKQEVMLRLHDRLKEIDDPEFRPTINEHIAVISFKNGKYLWQKEGFSSQTITRGELFTDGQWGPHRVLDPETVPRKERKAYYLAQAKEELRRYLDLQIALDEGGSEETHWMKRETYNIIVKDREKDPLVRDKGGLLAERMVCQFFEILTMDHTVPFEIVHADVAADVNGKIDFVIHRRNRNRAVGVKGEERTDVGIQFTTIPEGSPDLTHKEYQIDRAKRELKDVAEPLVQDIVLVSVPMKGVRFLFEKWRDLGSPPGGPQKLWSRNFKREVFEKVMTDILLPEEMDDCIGKVFPERRPVITPIRRAA